MRDLRARAAVMILLIAGCKWGSSAVTPPPQGSTPIPVATAVGTPQGPATTTLIGPAGGTLAAAGGGVTLSVPAGSVSAASVFKATPISSRAPGALETAFRLESSQPLTGPVKITFKGPSSYPANVGIRSLGIRYQDSRGFWVAPDGLAYDAAANTVTVTSPHLSDWSLVLGGTPALEGTFTLTQSVGTPFSATGVAALYAWQSAPEPTYYMTGSITLPPQLTSGTSVCVPDAATQSLELSVAEVHNADFRWGLNARWLLTCTDGSTGASSSQDLATLFDTLQINLVRCPGSYVGTQVNGDSFVQGSYTSDCGSDGAVSATWDFRGCTAGGVCQPSDPCRTGAVACNVGVASCNAGGNAPDGTSCGTGLVCSGGACLVCTDGAPCTPANACHAGTQSCTNGPVCNDAGLPVANGTSCGVSAVCGDGTCNACQAGAVCALDPSLCSVGALTCNTGFAVCAATGPAADGTTCGTDKVCSGGACAPCKDGDPCTPTKTCDFGTLSCATGIVCNDTGSQKPPGASCGTDAVCLAGTCNSCVQDQVCAPAPCRTGTQACGTGIPVCNETGTLPDGSPSTCGAGSVCLGGSCAVCVDGTACIPENPCFTSGTFSCSPVPVCTPVTPAPVGTPCGTGTCDASGACI